MTSRLPILNNEINQKYQLLAKIGSGGMGDVYLGIQRGAVDFSRLVVIKRIHDREVPPEYAEENARMFLNEASVVASLNHPHIVKIIDFCMAGSSFCIVMEYVEGETLRYIFSECVKEGKQIPTGLTFRLIYDACNTLHYAHNSTSNTGVLRKIIHRDIGLHNLMLDSNGYLKVIDFGIAKSSIQTDMTSPGLIKGNPSYMAPELFNKSTQDHRLDIYALGLCFYEMLTQTRAFQFSKTATVGEVIQEINHRELPPPSKMVPDLPEGVDDVVMKAIEKDRDQRYQIVEEFAEDLKRVTQHEFMSGSEAKKWFNENFAERLKERRDFGAKIVELAKKSDAVTEMAIPSKIPGGFPTINSVTTPSVTKRTGPPPPPPPVKRGFIQANLYRIVAGLAIVVGIVLIVNLYLLFSKPAPSSQAREETKPATTMDNLVVSCTPPESRLFINGKELGMIGEESLSFHVAPNEKHEIRLSKKGYHDFTLPFIGPSDGQKKINAILVRDETAKVPSMASTEDAQPKDDPIAEAATPDSVRTTGKKWSRSKDRKFKRKPQKAAPAKAESSEPKKSVTKPRRKIPLPDDNGGRRVPVVVD